jgi:hypothetical protein
MARARGRVPAQRKKGRKGGRASENGRKILPIPGLEHRTFPKPDPEDPSKFVRWMDGGKKCVDFLLHLFKREVDFAHTDDPQLLLAEIAHDTWMQEAIDNANHEERQRPRISSEYFRVLREELSHYVKLRHGVS